MRVSVCGVCVTVCVRVCVFACVINSASLHHESVCSWRCVSASAVQFSILRPRSTTDFVEGGSQEAILTRADVFLLPAAAFFVAGLFVSLRARFVVLATLATAFRFRPPAHAQRSTVMIHQCALVSLSFCLIFWCKMRVSRMTDCGIFVCCPLFTPTCPCSRGGAGKFLHRCRLGNGGRRHRRHLPAPSPSGGASLGRRRRRHGDGDGFGGAGAGARELPRHRGRHNAAARGR